MRIVVAPDSFGGTLTAAQAAAAIIDGWASVRPDDALDACPMSDGGEGFLDVVAAAVTTADAADDARCPGRAPDRGGGRAHGQPGVGRMAAGR